MYVKEIWEEKGRKRGGWMRQTRELYEDDWYNKKDAGD